MHHHYNKISIFNMRLLQYIWKITHILVTKHFRYQKYDAWGFSSSFHVIFTVKTLSSFRWDTFLPAQTHVYTVSIRSVLSHFPVI